MEIVSLESKIKKTEAVLNNIFKLQAIPQVLREILNYLSNDTVNTSVLTKLILKDQNLVTKVLAIANSPLYGLQRNVATLDFAVMILGIEEIRHIVSSLSIIETFKNKSDKYLDNADFWAHSFLVGNVAKKIAEDHKLKFTGEVFTAGFLHDLGLPVMHKYFHSSFKKIKDDVELNGTKFFESEMENIGLTHSEIAYRLLDKWNLPVILCEIVKRHHHPVGSDKFTVQTSVVHLADYATKYFNIGSFFWDCDLQLDENAAALIGFYSETELLNYFEGFHKILHEQFESTRFLL